MFLEICGTIIAIGSLLTAILTIINFFKGPTKFLKHKREEQKERYTQEIAGEVTQQVAKHLAPSFDEIKAQNEDQSKKIDILTKSSKDMLRKHILDLYDEGKETRTIREVKFKMLKDLYKDYTAEDGNSYIQDKYEKMMRWTVLPDEDE